MGDNPFSPTILPPAAPSPPVAPVPGPVPIVNPIPRTRPLSPDESDYWFVDMQGFLGKDFSQKHPLWMPDPRPGNDVQILLNGQETYREMVLALDPYPKSWPQGSFIYMANWIVYDNFNLDRDPQFRLVSTPGTTLRDMLRRASEKNVMIRALFWDRVITQDTSINVGPRDFINSLRGGHAILDGRVINSVLGDTANKGSHHQKLLLVNGPDGLIAFAGGVDFHPGRIFMDNDPLDTPQGSVPDPTKRYHDSQGTPLLDVHVKLRGPAAYDLLDLFLRRYADHPTAAKHEVYAPFRNFEPLTKDGVTVRVCSTFGDKPIRDATNVYPTQSTLDRLEGPPKKKPYREVNVVTIEQAGGGRLKGVQPYSFAPKGRQSGRAQLLYAISGARKFIYFEDQYMVGQEIAEAIRDVVKAHGVRVIGVIPDQSISTDFDQETLGALREDGGKNVLASTRLSRVIRVMYGTDANPLKLTFLFSPLQKQPDPLGNVYQYIHSKVFIMDDVFCTVGSMNFNRRSTTHDSELSLGFYERNPTGAAFAKRLRLRLWQLHLALPSTEQHLLDDPLDCIATVWEKIRGKPNEIKSPGGVPWRPCVARYNWLPDDPLGSGKHWYSYDPGNLGVADETEYVDAIPDPVVTSDDTRRLPTR